MKPVITRFSSMLAAFVIACGSVAALALDWEAAPGHRFAELPVPTAGKAGFAFLPASATGVAFTNVLSEERGLTNQLFMSGSGVAAGDVDGDGWCDLYFCGLDNANVLYRNRGGWKFEDVTAVAGVACAGQASTGAAFADVDGDGDLDLLVNAFGGGTRLFLNDGQGRFQEATARAGLLGKTASLSMALADMDGDGDLDLYVTNYRLSLLQDEPNTEIRVLTTNKQPVVALVNGRPPTAADRARFHINPVTMSIIENGEADVLYRNDGRGNFSPMSWTNGAFLDEEGRPLAAPPLDWGLSAMFRDINGDGSPDLYVCNDMDSIDRIWINQGAGRFQAIARLALRHTCLASMGVDFADINRDGLDDFFVVDMLAPEHAVRQMQLAARSAPLAPGRIDNRPQYMRNTLFLNRGDGTYAEIAQLSGLEATDWSWMPLFLDVDLDGYEDVLITTGIERSQRDADARLDMDRARAGKKLSDREFFALRQRMPRLDNPNRAFRNRGDLTFEPVGAAWGFDSRQISQGMALADLDNDGDQDVVINCMNAPALLYRNETAAPRVAVRLKGKAPNTRGVGAKIKVLGGPVPQSQEMISGGRYLSSDDTLRTFAAGHATNRLTIEVTWRSGQRSTVTNARPNQICEVDETFAMPAARSPAARRVPHFADVSPLLHHSHHEEDFNDFKLQPLLPRRFSRLGPGVSWCVFIGDGWVDMLLTSGRGGELGLYSGDGRGGFGWISVVGLMGRLADDQTTVLGWAAAPGVTKLLVGVANYESGITNDPAALQFDLAGGDVKPGQPLAGTESSAGPLAVADVDGDGHLDLFVGGRVVGGRYPAAASSSLHRQVEGRFQLDADFAAQFARVGLVSGAVFSDLNGDGWPDLALACDWGPVKIFLNEKGKFREATDALGLGQYRGFWNSVAAGDFDGDGRMDLVAGNWGRNTKYQRYLSEPVRVYFGDLDSAAIVQLLEAHAEPGMKKLVPWHHWDALARVMPWVQEKFASYQAYSTAGVADILGDHWSHPQEWSVTTLDSMVFLNRGDHFAAAPLPLEAQLAPVFGACVGDFDGDGREDVFLSQNFSGVDVETARYDAGRSVWLRGDGRGQFNAVPGQESGVMIYGDGRGAALSDYDGDGRVDLAVGQNGTETKLYHNEGARPGLRVRLIGQGGNFAAAGAVARLVFGQKLGAAREIHLGSGYWSQDSAVQVLATPEPPTKISVRWPGGKTTENDVPKGAKEITVDATGQLKVIR